MDNIYKWLVDGDDGWQLNFWWKWLKRKGNEKAGKYNKKNGHPEMSCLHYFILFKVRSIEVLLQGIS